MQKKYTSLRDQFEHDQLEVHYWQTFVEYRIMLRGVEIKQVLDVSNIKSFSDSHLMNKKRDFEMKVEEYFKTMLFENWFFVQNSSTELLKAAIQNVFLDAIEEELEQRGLSYFPLSFFADQIHSN